MVIASTTPQHDPGTLAPLGWRARRAVVADLEQLTTVGDWRASYDADRGILTATARGGQGAYTLFTFDGSVSLILARDEADVDLAKILQEEEVGFKIQEIASSLQHGSVEQTRVLEQLPELTTRPVTFLDRQNCWRASSGEGRSYLYYHDGSTLIQITCLPQCETAPLYEVRIQSSPDAPWENVTETVRHSGALNRAVQLLLQSPIA